MRGHIVCEKMFSFWILLSIFSGVAVEGGMNTCGPNCRRIPCDAAYTEVRNVALGAVATCSSVHSPPYICRNAVDGVEENVWASDREGKDNWIRLDFGRPRFLISGRLMQRGSLVEKNKDINLEFSDGSVQQFQLPFNSKSWDDIPLTPVRTRWVNITALSVWSTFNNGWEEIQLLAKVKN